MESKKLLHPTLWWLPILLTLIAPLPFPHGYYTFLRITVFLCALYIAFREYKIRRTFNLWFVLLGIVAILFNPIFPVHLHREIWAPIDVLCAALFLIHFFSRRKKLIVE